VDERVELPSGGKVREDAGHARVGGGERIGGGASELRETDLGAYGVRDRGGEDGAHREREDRRGEDGPTALVPV
jgi:hypothetical protein